MTSIHVLSGGAAAGLVDTLRAQFKDRTGHPIEGDFGAVGLMKDKLLAGAPCDVVILTQALVAQLAASGHVVQGSARSLGVVQTGIAVKLGDRAPDVSRPESLKEALLAANGIYFPDPIKATAGIHFYKVLQQLGVADQLAARLRTFPNGATAMREMAQCEEPGLMGCTQMTEILYTQGVTWVGSLPAPFKLATDYTAATCAASVNRPSAQLLVELLSGSEAAQQRLLAGFE